MVFLIIFPVTAVSAIDSRDIIPFQGVLKDNLGAPITGQANFNLRIYSHFTGASVTNDNACNTGAHALFCYYAENQTNIGMKNGVFTINMGNTTSLNQFLNFSNPLYLEVTIRGGPTGVGNDETLSPRFNLTSSAFSLSSEKASTNLDLNKKQIINATGLQIVSCTTTGGCVNSGALINTGGLTVTGTTTLNSGASITTGGLTVTGATKLNDGLTALGAATLNGGLGVTGATTLNGGLAVSGLTTTIDGTL